MAQTNAALFEFCQWPVIGASAVAVIGAGIEQRPAAIQDPQHLFRIVFPVGRRMKIALLMQLSGQQFCKLRFDDTPFVMAFFWPGIGEKQVYAGQAVIWNALFEYVQRIMTVYSDIAQTSLLQQQQQMADARSVYLDADIVPVRIGGRHVRQAVTVAKTDFQEQWCFALENFMEIGGLLRV